MPLFVHKAVFARCGSTLLPIVIEYIGRFLSDEAHNQPLPLERFDASLQCCLDADRPFDQLTSLHDDGVTVIMLLVLEQDCRWTLALGDTVAHRRFVLIPQCLLSRSYF